MKNYDVLLIHPPPKIKPDYGKSSGFARSSFIFFPMGLLSIADYLEREGLSVRIINYPLEQYFNRNFSLENFLKNINFKVCGIDLHWILHISGAIETSKIIKKINPNAKVIFGGFTASYYHKEILEYYKSIDGVIKGEGEVPLSEYAKKVLKNDSLESVQNLSYRDSNRHIKTNPITYVAKSLDDLNFSNVSLMNNAQKYFEKSQKIMGIGFNVPIGRGCPFNCPCCGGGQRAQILLNGRKNVTLRNPEKVIEDLHRVLDKFKVSSIFFGHGTYPSCLKYWKKLFELIQKEKFDIGGDIEIWRLPFPKELWSIFEKTFNRRYTSVSISPRTTSEKVQQKVAKICDPTFKFPKVQIEQLIKNANLFQNTLRIWLTIGYPFQTRKDVLKDFMFAGKLLLKYTGSRHNPISIMSEPYYISPGSPAHLKPKDFKIKIKYNSFPEILHVFKKTKITMANRVINYNSKDFSSASIKVLNNVFFLSAAPLFLTCRSSNPKKNPKK